jgi:hypothetical protein
MKFLGMIFGQIGSAFAVRAQRASLRSIGVFSNRSLLLGVAADLALAALFVFAAPLPTLLGTAALPLSDLALLIPYPFIVCGAEELRRYLVRRRAATASPARLDRADRKYTFNGSVVGTEKPEDVPFTNGYYHDTIQFPADAGGVPLMVQAVVHTSIGSIDLDWSVKVHK